MQIGDAAALFALTPATLRWWEKQGVLGTPSRIGDRRTYDSADLRRIGLAYMCCAIGMMPLDEAASVTTGSAAREGWQDAIGSNLHRIEQRIDQLKAAHRYLSHLLQCEEDDIGANCAILDSELVARTPRGRIAESDLLEAARLAVRTPTVLPTSRRNENDSELSTRDENDGDRCAACTQPIAQPTRGRRRSYCSPACRQQAYRDRGRPVTDR